MKHWYYVSLYTPEIWISGGRIFQDMLFVEPFTPFIKNKAVQSIQ